MPWLRQPPLGLAILGPRPYNPAVLNGPAGHAVAVSEAQSTKGARRRISAMPLMESKMPKLKTKSSAKKRFRLTATGRVKAGQAGKRHGMIKRSPKFIRDARGTTMLSDPDARIIKKNFLRNA